MVEEKFDSKSEIKGKSLEDMVNNVENGDVTEKKGKLKEQLLRDRNIWNESSKKLKRRSEDISNGNKKTKHEDDDMDMMDGDIFDWPSYLLETHSKAVPRSIFTHIVPECMCGFEPGMKLEVPNKDYKNTYWLATIVAKATPLILVRYEGFQDNNEEDFWCNTLSDDIHPVGWCARTKHALKPPKSIQGKEQNWYTYLIKNLTGAKKASENLFLKKSHPAHYIRAGQYIEMLDPYNPLCYWLARVNEVFSGRLNLQHEGWEGKEGEVWCFYLHENLRPVGYGMKHGLTLYPPKGSGSFSQQQFTRLFDKITALSKRIDNSIFNSLFMGWPDKVPHGLSVGMKLEAVHPKIPTSIHAASIGRIFDEHYFLVQIDTLLSTQDDVANSFIAHKDSPLIFPIGFCSKNGIVLCRPSGYIGKFTWEAYLRYAKAEPVPESFFSQESANDDIEVGMKLEAMDKEHPSHICVCTVTKIIGSHIWLHIDGDTRSDQIVSIKSNDVFPTGWCESTGHELQWPRPNTLEQKNRISSLRSTVSRQNRLEVLRKGKLHEINNESTSKDAKKEIKPKRKSRYLKGHRGHSRKRISYDDSDTIADNTIPIVCINHLAKEYNTEESIKKSFRLDSNGRLPKEIVTIDDDDEEEEESVTPKYKNEPKYSNNDISYLSYLKIKPKVLTKTEDELFTKLLMENDGNKGASMDALDTPNSNRERRSLNTVVDMLRSSTKQSRTQLLEQYKQSKARRNESTITGKENAVISSKDRSAVIDLCDDVGDDFHSLRGINHNSFSQDDPINIPGRGEYRIVEKIVKKQGDKDRIILKLGKPSSETDSSLVASSLSNVANIAPKSLPVTMTTTHVNDIHSVSNMVRNQPGLNEILKTRCHKVRSLCKDLPKNPLLWTKRHVAMFIQNADFKKYAKRFFDQEVDGHSLLLLTVWEIHHILGVHLGPAMKIHDYIFSLQQLVNDAYLKSKSKVLVQSKKD